MALWFICNRWIDQVKGWRCRREDGHDGACSPHLNPIYPPSSGCVILPVPTTGGWPTMTDDEIDALEAELAGLTDQEVVRRLNEAPVESRQFEIIVGETERRNLDG
ncbi:hypothetical protein [uncultured Sphingomonas sp.]|uniref:hypothetical protein n=1 Tax=uncultured Sphingomonas sp. TaxID=158754 RepID=UPI0025CEB5E0|nr:hypothetical protein [uncultured Sphingomonas sp.]